MFDSKRFKVFFEARESLGLRKRLEASVMEAIIDCTGQAIGENGNFLQPFVHKTHPTPFED